MKDYCGQRTAESRTAAFFKIMKSKLISIIFTAAFLSLAESGLAQGFVNLNFESATLVAPSPPFYVPFDQAFPGWTGTVGGVQQTLALSNMLYMDTSGISIINQNFTGFGYPPSFDLLEGNYTAVLQAGLTFGANPHPADTTLSQTALVPIGTKSLQFESDQWFDQNFQFLVVTLGGQTLSVTPLSAGLNYTLYGADVSAWAGQMAQLAFTVLAENPHVDNEYISLGAIQFSTQSIPEPSTLALAALGALFLGFRRRRR